MAIRRHRSFCCACEVCLIDVLVRALVFFLLFFGLNATFSVGLAATPPRMRPYTGIGLFVFNPVDRSRANKLQMQLYEEPGLQRVGMLNDSRLSGNDWIFGLPEGTSPLVVSARKGDWLRVTFDEAGREAWLEPENQGSFQSWEQFLKTQTGRMLPGLQPQYYQLQQQPAGRLLSTLTPRQAFKVLRLEGAWGMVLTDQGQMGWVRWSDDDGRLLVGINP